MTKLQQAAYDAQWAAALPVSDLARFLLGTEQRIHYRQCAAYIGSVQQMRWFGSAFASHAAPITVVGGAGVSHADSARRRVRIGTGDRSDVGRCEAACLHELAHIVTCDYDADRQVREPAGGPGSSKGHHHAWRANFVFIVEQALGKGAASRLRREFNAWGLPTHG